MRTILRRAIVAPVITAAVFAGGVTAATAAPAAGSHTITVAHRCNLSSDTWTAQWGTKDSGSINYAEIKWTANPCIQRAQVEMTCYNYAVQASYVVKSGPIKETGTWSEQQCQRFDQALVDSYRLTNADGSWRSWTPLCAGTGCDIKQGRVRSVPVPVRGRR